MAEMTDTDPAIVEVAAKATYVANSYCESPAWEALEDGVREVVREQVRIALSAAAPLIAAKALREAAIFPGSQLSYAAREWLRDRADDLEAGRVERG